MTPSAFFSLQKELEMFSFLRIALKKLLLLSLQMPLQKFEIKSF